MKPADRALNIVVVGLGQAGGNLASEFARLGYRAIALNTAHTDLSSLASAERVAALSSDQRIYIGIDGYDGAGADMNYGRECIRENAERIREVVSRHAEGADVVIVTAGLGGGTGSSVSELVNVLQALDLPMIVLATLPNEYESGIAKVNAVRAVSDLVKHDSIGWIFADNSRLSTQHGGVSLDKYFEKVNSVIIRPLDELNRLNNRKGIHPIRSLDGEDFRALLLSNGVLNYSESVLSALTVDTVIERVRESLQQSTMMPHGFSTEEVAYMGIVLEAGEEVLRGTPFSFFEQLNEKLKHETGGAAIYMGVYRLDSAIDGGSARLRLIASTQSLPEGIQAMVNDARREGGTLRDKLQRSISSLDLGEIEEFDLFKTTLRTGHGQSASRRRPAKPALSVPDTNLRRASERVGRTGSSSSPASAPAPEADADPDPGRGREPSSQPLGALGGASDGRFAARRSPSNPPPKPSVVPPSLASRAPVHSTDAEQLTVEPTGEANSSSRSNEASVASPEPLSWEQENTSPDTPAAQYEEAGDTAARDTAAAADTAESADNGAPAVNEESADNGAPADTAESVDTEVPADTADFADTAVPVDAVPVDAVSVDTAALYHGGAGDAGSAHLADEPTFVGDVEPDVEVSAEDLLTGDSDAPTTEFQMDSLMAAAAEEAQLPEWSGTNYLPGTPEFNALDAHRQAEGASYQKLVATFLRTEFDSTKRRVARRLDAARRSEDALSRDLAHTALQRLVEEGQLAAFEAILQDASSVSL